MTLDLLQLTEKVKALAIEAGGFIREERNRFNRNAVEKKTCTRLRIVCR